MNYQHLSGEDQQSRSFAYAKSKRKEHAKKSQFDELLKSQNNAEEICQDTMTKPIAASKIKINFDEEQTRRDCWKNGISTLAQSQKKMTEKKSNVINQKKKIVEAQPQPLEIPYNKKVEEIMNKKPLRERLSGLLPPQLQLPISFDHQQLLKRMELIDRTIQFLGTHRNMKLFFFQTIRKSIYETTSIAIQIKLIQQLLFLDQNCYSVEWRMNQKTKRYDIKITLPRIESIDLRKSQMRKKIVKYLICKEGEFLIQKKLSKVENYKWHDSFDYKKIQIPQKTLPVHPNYVSSDIRAFPDQQIEKINNPALKMLFKSKKQISQVKSVSAASVADMIFNRVPASQISNQILSMVRQKQKRNNEQREKQKQQEQMLDKEAVLKIFDEILLIYMSKNVSSIFKVTLIEILQQRLKFKDNIISKYMENLLDMQDLGYFKIVQSSKKIKVVQIDRQKYKSARAILQSKF